MTTFEDEHGNSWEVHPYGAEVSGKADGPPPPGERMIAFHHPSRAESAREVTTVLPDDATLEGLSEADLRELLAIAQDSET
jgi:hypothetical protein